jgi:GNAT superfamily N-acetyltransferase
MRYLKEFNENKLDDIITKAKSIKIMDDRFVSHLSTPPWGIEFLIMEKNGKGFGRLYMYNDELDTIYLDMLSVSEEQRKQKIGTDLQKIREDIGRELGANESHLWVVKDSWMFEWYKRRGYVHFDDFDGEENAVWMKKKL